jgi:tRNA nucleotidyltransferase (CCA-adding enzyme)
LAHLQKPTDRSVRRLARRLAPETIRGLSVVITADAFGRPPRPREVPPGLRALQAKAAELLLAEAAPKPILRGCHLMALGMQPGKGMGVLLAAAFEAQLEGQFADLEAAERWARDKLRDAGATSA